MSFVAPENSGMQFQTYPDAVIPGLAFGLHGSHPQSVAHGSGGLSWKARDSVCYDPHLGGGRVARVIIGPSEAFTRKPELCFICCGLTWSSGPTDTLVALLEMSSQAQP